MRRSNLLKGGARIGAVLCTLLIFAPAWPQPAPTSSQKAWGVAQITAKDHVSRDSQAFARKGSPTEAEIIVTAQKRNERVQDVPIAMSVVKAEELARSGGKNLIELQGVAPGIFFSGNAIGGSSPITIRGVSGVNTYLLDDPVALYVNGVYQTSGQFGSSDLLDISSIEIIRGPQGTLQGRNATAGALLINSADPTSDLSGYARASIAGPLETRAEGAIGGPLGPTLQVRLAANHFYERGWAHNIFDGIQIGGGHGYAVRGTARWRPTEDLEVRFIAGRNFTYTEPALARFAVTNENPSPEGRLQPPGTLTPTTPLSKSQLNAIENDFDFALNRYTFSRISDDSLVLNATYSLGNAELVSVSGYDRIQNSSQTDIDSIAVISREGYVVGDVPTRNFSEELRLQSTETPRFSYIIGVYYAHSDQHLDTATYNLRLTSPVNLISRFHADQTINSYAGFADATLRLNGRISATAGIRYTRETKSFDLVRSATNEDTGSPFVLYPDYRPPSADYQNVSMRAKLAYKPTESSLFYVGYSTGFKSGGFNAFGSDPAFRPETLNSFEGGFKASILNHHATLGFAAYLNHYDDMQVRYAILGAGLGISNAATSKIQGFEIEGALNPLRDLNFSGSLAYTDGRFTDFRNALDVLNNPVGASGNHLPRSPKWEYSARASFTPALANNVRGTFDVSWQHRSVIYLYQTDQSSSTLQGRAVGEFGARVGVTLERQQLTAAIYGTNLANGRSVNGLNLAFSYPSVTFNKPRSIGMQLEKRF